MDLEKLAEAHRKAIRYGILDEESPVMVAVAQLLAAPEVESWTPQDWNGSAAVIQPGLPPGRYRMVRV